MANQDKLSEQHITHFSKLVYSQQYEPAMLALMEILHAVEISGIAITVKANETAVGKTMSVIASAATALLSDPRFALNRQGFSALMTLKGHLRSVFASSQFRDMTHLVANITNQTEKGMEIPALNKFLLVCTLDIAPDDILKIVTQLDDEPRFLFWLSCFDNKYVLSEREEVFKHEMLDMLDGFKNVRANSIGELQSVTRAWMHSSYLDDEDKHRIKSGLNVVLRNTMKHLGVVEPALPAIRKQVDRPRLLVILEFWQYNNAMYRCFASSLARLTNRFEVVAMIEGTASDDRALALFDDVVSFSTETPMKKLVGKIVKLAPDIVFYPSLGMQQTAIQFAQLRLAPIQVMSVGHPASSFSDAIDYVVFEEDILGDPACFTEKILLAKRGAINSLPPDAVMPLVKNVEHSDIVRISVNSMYFKLSHRFLNVCKNIFEASQRPIEFHFLIGLNPFNHAGVSDWIKRHVPSSICYNHLDYAEYSEKISQCDIQLAPFPFGNTNSFIDAIRLGLPTVCLDGREIHSHGDTVMAHRVGLPQFCIAQTTEEYEAAVLKLILDDQLRQGIRQELIESNAVKKLYEDHGDDAVNDLAEIFDWAYRQHEKIQATDRQVWRPGTRGEVG